METKENSEIKIEFTTYMEMKENWKAPKLLGPEIKKKRRTSLFSPKEEVKEVKEEGKVKWSLSNLFKKSTEKKEELIKRSDSDPTSDSIKKIDKRRSFSISKTSPPLVNNRKSIRRFSFNDKNFKSILDLNRDKIRKKMLLIDDRKKRGSKRKSILENHIIITKEGKEDLEMNLNDLNERLYFYIIKKDLENFKKEIKKSDKNWIHPIENVSLLHKATKLKELQFIEILIENGFDIDQEDKMKRTALLISVSLGYKEISIYLLGMGANIHQKDGYGCFPLFIAFKHHHFHLIQDLLLFGADINMKRENGCTLLHEAIIIGDSLMLDEILKIKNLKLNQKETNGKTPLLQGIEGSSVDVFLKFLKTKGVDISAQDDLGRNLFHLIAIFKRHDILKEILTSLDLKKYKDLLISKDKRKQQIPLHFAVESKNFLVVKYFLTIYTTINMEIMLKDINQLSPYDLSIQICEKEYNNLIEKVKFEEIFDHMNLDSLLIEDLLFNLKSKKK